MLRLRTKEASVDAGYVGVGGKSTRQGEEVVSGAQDHTGTITKLKAIFVADIKIVLIIRVQEKVLANSGNVQER